MKLNINPKYINSIFCLVIVAIVFLVYGNTLNHDYNLDDSYYINILPEIDAKPNEIIKVFTKLFSKSDYRPIPTLHLAIEQYCFGQKPSVFHFFNVFYYALLGIVLYFLFVKLKVFHKKWAVLLLVTLFLIHPSHSNVVASIKNRDVILSMFYGILGISSFLKYYDDKKYFFLLISMLFFYISILCKADGVMFPLIGMVLIYFSRNIELKKVGIFVSIIIALVLGLHFLSTNYIADEVVESVVTDFFENPLVNNESLFGNIPVKLYLTNFYHKFMLKPNGYHFYFGYNQISIPKANSALVVISVIAHLLCFFILLGLLVKRKKGNFLMGFILYFVSLAPLILFLDSTAGIVAVRYSFNASLGFALMVTSGLIYGYNSKNEIFQLTSKIVTVVIIAISIFFTIDRNKDWENKEILFTHDLKYLTQSYMANRMGGLYFKFLEEQETTNLRQKQKYLKLAGTYLNIAKGIYDKDPILWQNLGLLYWKQEDYKQTFLSFKKAVSLDSTNIVSWNYYGNFSEFANDFGRAEEAYKQVVTIDPHNDLGYKNLTFALMGQQKFDEALALNKNLLSEDKMKKFGYENLGHIYIAVKDTTNAILFFNYAFDAGLENELLKNDISKFSKTF